MCHNMIKILRIEKGFTQEDLATKIHVVRQTISKWENGESEPRQSDLERIAEVLNVPICELHGLSCNKNIKIDNHFLSQHKLFVKLAFCE